MHRFMLMNCPVTSSGIDLSLRDYKQYQPSKVRSKNPITSDGLGPTTT